MLTGAEYDPMREFRAGSVATTPGSPEEQAVADNRERGLSYTKTTLLINRQCLQDRRPTVTRSAVCTCEFNMVREVNLIEKRPQGNKDAGSNWAKARHRFVVQMLVRLGAKPDLDEFLLADGSVPACFDREKLTPMHEDGIAWWDEVHKECFFGDFREGSTTQMRFPRDADGKYNPKGEYREKTELLTVKYNKQGRFCLGVGIVDRGNGPEGERIELFDYTTKNVISIKDTEKLINSTIAEVKQLPRDHKKWCISNRADGVYFEF